MIRTQMDRDKIREEGNTRAELEGYLEQIHEAALLPPGANKNRLQVLLSDQLDAICQEAKLEHLDALQLLSTKVKNHILARGLGFATPRDVLAYFYGWCSHEKAAPYLARYKKPDRYGN